MTKEQYLTKRNKGVLDTEMCFEYWKDHKKPEYKDFATLDEFNLKFVEYFNKYEGLLIGLKIFTKDQLAHKVFDYFDKKFEI